MPKSKQRVSTSLRVAQVAEAQGCPSITELHYRSRVGYNTLFRLWHNQPGIDPQLSTLEKIARALGVPVTALLEDEVPDEVPVRRHRVA